MFGRRGWQWRSKSRRLFFELFLLFVEIFSN